MADAPAGGGKISGMEIALIVVLVLGALMTLSGNPIKPFAPATTTTPVKTTKPVTTGLACGITLTRPTKLEALSYNATITGKVFNCDFDTTLSTSTTLNVQIVDSNGAPMSVYTPVTLGAVANNVGTFDINIPLNGAPARGTGYVIVTGVPQSDGTTLTARVPVTFK